MTQQSIQQTLEDIRTGHKALLVQLERPEEVDLEQVRVLLKTLAQAGTTIENAEDRSLLHELIRYWSSFINDKTGAFPAVQLQPFDASLQRAVESLKRSFEASLTPPTGTHSLLTGLQNIGSQILQNNDNKPPHSLSPQSLSSTRPPTLSFVPPVSLFPTTSALSPSGSANMDTTRYLCAAGYLDEDFQDYVMRHVIYEERRTLCESYGVDILPVVSWCKAGLKRINVRDTLLTSLLVLVIFGDFLLINLVTGFINNIVSSTSLYSTSSSPSFSLFTDLIVSLVVIILALTVIMALNVEKWIKHRWPHSHPGLITYLVLLVPCGLFGFIAVPLIWLTIFVELIFRYYGNPTKRLRKNTFNPQARPVPLDYNLETKLRESFSTGRRNVVAYSGFKPFAGAGDFRGGWSFVIDTSKGAYDTSNLSSTPTRKTPLPFTVSSLYNAIEKDVWALSVKNVLEIEGKLYVHGQYLLENPLFFNATAMRPVTSVDPRFVEQYKEHPTEDVRYYQCLRFNFWRGEMVLTAFLRFVQHDKDLFAEIDYFQLPPMKPEYYWVDKIGITPPLSKIWEIYKRSLDGPLQMWFGAPFRLLRGYFYAAQQRRLAHTAFNDPAFDYGTFTSLRQKASDDRYHHFFHEIDETIHLKVIEKQILETVVNFLEVHQIDTTELLQRQQMILNNDTVKSSPINNTDTLVMGVRSHVINNPALTRQGSRPERL